MDCSTPGLPAHQQLPEFTQWASLVAQRLKRLPGMWETPVRSLSWEERKWQPTPVLLPEESMEGGAW